MIKSASWQSGTSMGRVELKMDRAGRAGFDPKKAMQGCPVHHLRGKLRDASLRPTRQRIALGWLLFGKGDRHVTAESLYDEAIALKMPVSLATVYNTLRQFTEAGLLMEVAAEGARNYFDTRTSPHHHYFLEETGELLDIPEGRVGISVLQRPPEGMEITRVDVVIRLRRKD
jgi:Fur family iron response transcriptional regulator